MKTQLTTRCWPAMVAISAALVCLPVAEQARALDVIGSTGVIYSNVKANSEYNSAFVAANLFTTDVSCQQPGTAVNDPQEYARLGGGTCWVSFQLDQVYTNIGSIFYAQRNGLDPNADKISKISVWTSQTTAFGTNDPGTPPDSVVLITNTAATIWTEYLMTNNISGQYFLLKMEQSSPAGNPGGRELRFGGTLNVAPAICSVTPASTNTYDGSPVQFLAYVTGTAPLAYQWQAGAAGSGIFTNLTDSGGVVGSTSPTLTFQSAPLGNSDLQLVVTNSFGAVTSTPVNMNVSSSAPQIATDVPTPVQSDLGYTLSLPVTVQGSLPIQYQWQHNGVPLTDNSRTTGSQSNILTVTSLVASDAGTYQLFITNKWGNTASSLATVTINPSLPVLGSTGTNYSNVRADTQFDSNWAVAHLFNSDVTGLAPGIGTLPGGSANEYADQSRAVAWVAFQVDQIYTNIGSVFYAQRQAGGVGDNMDQVSIWASTNAAFATSDPGTPPMDTVYFQDQFDGQRPVWREYFLTTTNNIVGKYFLLKLQNTHAGASNPGGNEFRLGLAQPAPVIGVNPVGTNTYSGKMVTLTAYGSSSFPLSYQWQSSPSGSGTFVNVANGTGISGANSSTLVVSNVTSGAFDYQLVVANSFGSATSAVATVTASDSCVFITSDISQPAFQVPAGFPFAIPVGVDGSQPIQFQWTRNSAAMSDNGRITGSHSSTLLITNLVLSDTGTYQLLATNQGGTCSSASSTTVMTVETNGLTFYDGSAWTLNGGATVDATSDPKGVLTLTDGGGSEGRTAYYDVPVPMDNFSASFVYTAQKVGTQPLADGTAFVLQNSSFGAVANSGGGGNLGYGGIAPSAAIALNIYNSSQMAFNTNGNTGNYVSTSPVNLRSGDPIAVTMQYDGATLTVALTDLTTTQRFAKSYQVDLPAVVHGHTAYVGFGGGDGAAVSIQTVSNFVFNPIPPSPPQVLADLSPLALTQPIGLPLILSPTIGGSKPMTYQWKFNGAPLTDGGAISGAGSNVLNIAYVLSNNVGTYQLFITNAYGSTNTSIETVTVTNAIGFGDGTAWAMNGVDLSLDTTNGILTLTDTNAGGEVDASFLSSRVLIDSFVASFTYQETGANPADGAAFILQNSSSGATAVGNNGGALGYYPISPSAAVEFNLYSGSPGGRGVAIGTNGATAQNGGGSPYRSTSPVDLASGNPIGVTIYYTGNNLSLMLTDTVAAVSFVTNWPINLTNVLGNRYAYVGFSASDGGLVAQQQISNFKFTSIPTTALQHVGDTLALSWPVADVGYTMQNASDLANPTWTAVTNTVTTTNGLYQVTVPIVTTNRFFRLATP